MKILTYDPKKKKEVLCGELIGDTLFRLVKPEHFMNVVQGYGIQEIAFQEIVHSGCKKIVLEEEGLNSGWSSEMVDWLNHSKVADYKHGKQRFLSTKYMHRAIFI